MSFELQSLEKCICCGAEIFVRPDQTSVQCAYCRTHMSVSRFTQQEKRLAEAIDELKQRADAHTDAVRAQIGQMQSEWRTSKEAQLSELFRQAETAQRGGSFDKAIERYEALLLQCPHESEIHWRIMLCRYGVQYVCEQSSGAYLPTITKMNISSVLEDESCRCALKYAPDRHIRAFYEEEAQRIDAILMKYQQINGTDRPYDVFISVKQGDEHGQATSDGYEALEMYHHLEKLGWKVFNSRTCLKQYAGTEYEPHIMHALSTAKVLVVIASNEEYMYSPWVRNEWRRFRWLQVNNHSLPPENQHERRLIAYILGSQKWPMPELGGLQIIRAASDPAPMATLTGTIRSVCGERASSAPTFPNIPAGSIQGMSPEQMAQFMQMFAMYQQMQGMQINGQPAAPVQVSNPSQQSTPAQISKPVQQSTPVQTAKPAQQSTPAQTSKPAQQSTPVQTAKPTQQSTPAQTAKPAQQSTPVQTAKPAQQSTPVQTAKPAQQSTPVQTSKPAQTALTQSERTVRGIFIGDEALEQVLREKLGKTSNQPITAEDLAGITELVVNSKGVSNINILQLCTSLTALSLWNNRISDIAALSRCTKLTSLFLSKNQITDISPLSSCTRLTKLALHDNQISDIRPLSACTSLRYLRIDGNLSPMRGKAVIDALKKNHCQISDEGIRYAPDNVQSSPASAGIFIGDEALEQVLREKLGKTNGQPITAEDLAGITELVANSKGVSNINILQLCTSLTALSLWNNRISDIAALSRCTKLTSLFLSKNQITDISPLSSCTRLTKLALHDNQISDIRPLSACTSLRYLRIDGNLSPMRGKAVIDALKKNHCQISDEGIRYAPDNAQSSPASAGISIGDEALEQVLREKLGKTNGQPITAEDLAEITELSASFKKIFYIGALQYCTSLTKLNLGNNQIGNIDPLRACTRLVHLYLNDNRIDCIDALADCPNLRSLNLFNNQIDNLAPLKGHAALRVLNLGINQISDLSPLSDCSALQSLDLSCNRSLSDLSVLARCTSLRNVSLDYNSLSIHSKPVIEALTAQGCQISSRKLNFLIDSSEIGNSALEQALRSALNKPSGEPITEKELAGISHLSCSDGSVYDIRALKYCTSLKNLFLERNQISDLSPLSHCTALSILNLSENRISDLSELVHCPALSRLLLSENQISDITPLNRCNSLSALYIDKNPVSGIDFFSRMRSSTPNARTLAALKKRGCDIKL